jgi:uncharacterized protein (TIGR02391 family)
MAKRSPGPSPVEPKEWRAAEEIDRAIPRLERRITELEQLDLRAAVFERTGADDVAESNVREAIRDVFGSNSPEFREHQYLRLWAGPTYINMHPGEILDATEKGRHQALNVLRGLIGRLAEKRSDLQSLAGAPSLPDFDRLLLHPRIAEVAQDLFRDGHHWEAVFAASKALVNYVKEKAGRHDLDGAGLMRTVFSPKAPILAFNEGRDQTDSDEQEGMMHLYEGAVLAIRNPGGHSFPEGPSQRAVEYISLLSLLAYRTQEAKRRAKS